MNLIDTLLYSFLVGAFILLLEGMSCAGSGKRETWEDCAGVYHEECLDSPDFRGCEYEYYKECINGG